MSLPQDEYPVDPHEDDSAMLDCAMQERQEAIIAAIWECAMRGVEEDTCRLLCAETGVKWRDVKRHE